MLLPGTKREHTNLMFGEILSSFISYTELGENKKY